MTAVVPRLRVPKTASLGEVVEIKTLISHPMESGLRRDGTGRLVPRNLVRRLVATYNDALVFEAEWHPAVSANPYLSFDLRVTEPGTLAVAWIDEEGRSWHATAAIAVV